MKPRFRTRLNFFLLGVCLVPTLVVILGGGFALRYFIRNYVENATLGDLREFSEIFRGRLEAAQMEAHTLAAVFPGLSFDGPPNREKEGILDVLARDPRTDLRRFAGWNAQRFLRVILYDRAGMPLVAFLARFGTHGVETYCAGEKELSLCSITREELRELAAFGQWISPALSLGNIQFVRCLAQVDPDSGGIVGAVGLDIRLQLLIGKDPGNSRFEGQTFVLDENGRVLIHPDPGFRGTPLDKADPVLAGMVSETGGKAVAWGRRDGGRFLFGLLPLEGAPGRWKIGRTANVEPLLGGLDDVVGWGIALALSATVLSFLAAWKISRHFSGSVEALAEGVRKVGRGELDASVRVDGEDELGALARGFNRMILDLKSAVHVREERVRLEERDRLRSELLANVSHDLRTPLTAVQWSVENLQAGVAGEMNEVQKTYLQGIEKSAGHLLLLIDDLISFSRLDAGRLKLETSPLELAFVAREAVRLLSPLIEKKRLAVAVEGEARLEGDGDRLRQVFSNLIDNAIKFSPEGGRIEVAIREEGDVALALVRDQGPGIEPSLREAVFERFRSERGKGVGIGLNLARSLVRLHGGDLTAEDAPGGGACFRVELPKGGPHGKRMRADC